MSKPNFYYMIFTNRKFSSIMCNACLKELHNFVAPLNNWAKWYEQLYYMVSAKSIYNKQSKQCPKDCICFVLFFFMKSALSLILSTLYAFFNGIHSMQGWTATTRHGVIIKKAWKG